MARWRARASRAAALALAVAAGAAAAQETADFRCLGLTSTRGEPERGSPAAPLLHELAQRLPEALAACEEGVRIRPKEGRMHVALGRVRLMSGDLKGAMEAAQAGAALGGSFTAPLLLGALHARAGDYATALRLYRDAARLESFANFSLGVMWANGLGVQASEQDATNFFRLAALGGDSLSMQVYGERLAAGRGVAPDRAKAEEWWKKAAEKLDPEGAQHPLRVAAGAPYLDAPALLAWYSARAQAGEPWAQAYLGTLYEAGQWVKQDLAAAAFWYRKAALAGNGEATISMQRFYSRGLGVERDAAEARRWGDRWHLQRCEVTIAAQAGPDQCDRFAGDAYDPQRTGRGVDSMCLKIFASQAVAACRGAVAAQPSVLRFRTQYARALAHEGKFEQAAREAGAAAAKGSTAAMVLLGVMSQRGLGVPQDGARALSWYRKAAAAGDGRAARLVLASAEQGVGVAKGSAGAAALADATRANLMNTVHAAPPGNAELAEKGDRQAQHNLAFEYEQKKDYAQAIKWYTRAAEQGWGMSAMNLAQMYENGIGVKPDPAQAIARYRPLADQGNAEARYRLAVLHSQAGDYAEAARRLSKGVEHNDYRAMLDLGQMHEQGTGMPKDAARAAALYEKAVGSSRWARAKVGAMALAGNGMPRDYKKALLWLERAAQEGDHSAHNNLGQMYERGLGVAIDYRKARDHYLYALYGLSEARGNLESLYERELGVPTDAAQAIEWYRPGAAAGIAAAQYQLGRRYARGQGVERDPREAVRWLGAAADQGHAAARREAGEVYFAMAQTDPTSRESRDAMLRAALYGHPAAEVVMVAQLGAAWPGLKARGSRIAERPQFPTGTSATPDADKQRGMQVRAASTGAQHAVAVDAGAANVYTIIPWWPPIDAKQASERK